MSDAVDDIGLGLDIGDPINRSFSVGETANCKREEENVRNS